MTQSQNTLRIFTREILRRFIKKDGIYKERKDSSCEKNERLHNVTAKKSGFRTHRTDDFDKTYMLYCGKNTSKTKATL